MMTMLITRKKYRRLLPQRGHGIPNIGLLRYFNLIRIRGRKNYSSILPGHFRMQCCYNYGIYASARETDTLGIDGMTLVHEINKYHGHVIYSPQVENVQTALTALCRKGDVVVFMGAGDIYMWEKTVCMAV